MGFGLPFHTLVVTGFYLHMNTPGSLKASVYCRVGFHFGLRLLSHLCSLIKLYVCLIKKYMSSVHRRVLYLKKVYAYLYKYMSIKYYCLELLLFETKHLLNMNSIPRLPLPTVRFSRT